MNAANDIETKHCSHCGIVELPIGHEELCEFCVYAIIQWLHDSYLQQEETAMNKTEREHLACELKNTLSEISQPLPKGMLVVGYEAKRWCDRCEDSGNGSYHVHFDIPVLWNGRQRNYLYFCDLCLWTVAEAEAEFQRNTQ